MSYIINMLSYANKVKGQGVGSASFEAIELIKDKIKGFNVFFNENIKSDITHIHSINPSFYFRLNKLKRFSKVVVSVHFLPETVETSLKLPKPFKKIFYKYMISFYKKADYLVTVNPYFIKKLKNYGICEDKVSYIPNFVDEKRFYPLDNVKKSNLFDKYNLKKNAFTIVCAGQLQTRKGIFDFIKCATKLKDFQFVWAGGFSFGKISDGYKYIQKIIDNPPENVKFLGIIDRENMNEIYNLADVFFLPSFEELFPMTLLEAMNCKIPIVVRDLDIYKDILFDYCIYEKNVDGFCDVLKKLKEDKDYYEKSKNLSFNGHLFYSKEHLLDLWQKFYDNIVNDL